MVLGNPFGLRAKDHSKPIARRGSVGRVDADCIVVDTFVFPGNSGGPVVYVPAVKLSGSISSEMVNEERLVGVVSSYVPYIETAVSPQTGRARISFEDNSGLAQVVPAEEMRALVGRDDVVANARALLAAQSG